MPKRKADGARYGRIVVKLGTNLLTAGTERLDLATMADLVGQVARLQQSGIQVTVVSSGAIAAGRHKLAMNGEKQVPLRQVLAAVGQSRLMYAYDQLFGWHDITVAQTLLTKADLADRAGYLNARNTLLALMELGVIAIVNENDVVATDEIEGARFGDNDNLSAMVANLVDADLLVLLSDVDGLHAADPAVEPQAPLIPRIERIDAAVEALAGDAGSARGIGGMVTKIEAAKLATSSGVAVVIASGKEPDVLVRLATGEGIGTLFAPTASKVESRKRWLLSGLCSKGCIVVDGGAAAALRRGKGSLLPAGIVAVSGDFARGDVVELRDAEGRRIGCGIADYGAEELARIKGRRSTDVPAILGYEYGAEAVHRNNLALV